jgi:hypothetical protein
MATPSLGIAQGWQHLVFQDTGNYFTLKQKALDYFNSDNSLRYQSESGYKQFARWTWFWDDRIDQDGSYGTALENMYYILDQRMKDQGSDGDNTPYTGNWQSIGPVINDDSVIAHMGLVQSLWIDTTDFRTIYAGSNSGGLFVTNDSGANWRPLTDVFAALGVSDIVVQGENIYIATGIRSLGNHYGHGVVKSEDGGQNWQFTNLNPVELQQQSLVITRLLAHPVLEDCFYAIGFLNDGKEAYIFKTYDGFQSFDTCIFKRNAELFDIEFKPGDTNTIYVSGSQLYRTSNAGLTWDTLTDHFNLTENQIISRAEIAVHPDDTNRLLTILEAIDTTDINHPVYCQRLYRSYNQGETFQEIPPNDSIEIFWGNYIAYDAGYFKMELEISPSDANTIYTGGLYVRKYDLYDDTAHLLEIAMASYFR